MYLQRSSIGKCFCINGRTYVKLTCLRQPRVVKVYAVQQAQTRRTWLKRALSTAWLLGIGAPSLADENAAVLESIKKFQAGQSPTEQSVEQQELGERNRLLGAKGQLAQVERLAAAGDYRAARMQLRSGPMSSVRRDLRSAEKELGGLRKEDGDALVSSLERLDEGLRSKVPAAELSELVARVRAAVDLVDSELILPE
uniref:Uncharacterized protein n=1 Tax=Tetraselmis sp. GSL018 TaxID=582737 RepID=A0A061REX2_9CHLO|mmetsp:Transcript_19191/g.45786  ORF Transcript_19191/g.45786 Transcript_19191/m.45786 type:complete len:198 (-) Transcript_19191:769-1362(-)